MLGEVVVGVVFLLVFLNFLRTKPRGIPPGEWGWPIIGSLPSFSKPLTEIVDEKRAKYGDIFSWKIGSRLFVVLCDFKTIKSAFGMAECSNRPELYTYSAFTGGKESGLAFNNGKSWAAVRRFTLRQLKDFGMGKSILGGSIKVEVEKLIQDFKKHAGEPTEVPWSLNVAVLNVLWKMVADKTYDVNDEKIQEFEKMNQECFQDCQGTAVLFDIFPWLLPLVPSFVLKKMGACCIQQKSNAIKSYIEEVILEHEKTLDKENPKDFIDHYLLESEKIEDGEENLLKRDEMWVTIADLFVAGSETTSSAIRYCIFYLAKYPEIQKKIQKELDDNLQPDTLPSLEDKEKTPYTEAFINEVMRTSTLAPLGLSHCTSEDVEIEGYRIPKNTVIMSYIEGCHKDAKYWREPEKFNPQNFLDEDGNFVHPSEGFLPFSIGRRICVGESLGKMDLYLFVSSLCKTFTFEAPEGEELVITRDPKKPLFNLPQPFKVVIKARGEEVKVEGAELERLKAKSDV